jgi:hypothetical protein
MTGYLKIVYCDDANNRFVTLGGAGFDTMRETRRRFAAIPAVADTEQALVLDLMRGDDIVGDKFIARATAEELLGDTFENLLSAALEGANP